MESVSPWIAGLCECVDGHPEAGVLPHKPGGVLLSEEGVHEDERHVRVIGPVQVLNLLHRQVQGGQIIPHWDCASGSAEQMENSNLTHFMLLIKSAAEQPRTRQAHLII